MPFSSIFDSDPDNTSSNALGSVVGTSLNPLPPDTPMELVSDQPNPGDFLYQFHSTQDAGFTNTAIAYDAAQEGALVSYHAHALGLGNPAVDEMQLVIRKVGSITDGRVAVSVTDTEIQVGLDTTGLAEGDVFIYDGSGGFDIFNLDLSTFSEGDLIRYSGGKFVSYQLDDGEAAYPVAANEPLRILRGDVNDDGTEGHGDTYDPGSGGPVTLWTSTNTGTGLFSVSFGYAFPEVPTVTLGVSFNVPSARSRVISFTSPPATGGFAVAIQEFNETTQQFDYIDVGFHFIAIGLNGNY